jgi:Transposase domain (DUF772)
MRRLYDTAIARRRGEERGAGARRVVRVVRVVRDAVRLAGMSMGRRKEKQPSLWVIQGKLPRSPGHRFYEKFYELLREADFDRKVETLCQRFYDADDKAGRPSIPPGLYFRMFFIGFFEGIESERGIEWRCADSLSLRDFLGLMRQGDARGHQDVGCRRKPRHGGQRRGFVLRLLWRRGVLALRRYVIRLCVVTRILLREPREARGRLRRHERAKGRTRTEDAVVGDGRVERWGVSTWISRRPTHASFRKAWFRGWNVHAPASLSFTQRVKFASELFRTEFRPKSRMGAWERDRERHAARNPS